MQHNAGPVHPATWWADQGQGSCVSGKQKIDNGGLITSDKRKDTLATRKNPKLHYALGVLTRRRPGVSGDGGWPPSLATA
jgi:hypothetical protein